MGEAKLLETNGNMSGSDMPAYECSKCGYDENTDNASYCGGCGAKFDKMQPLKLSDCENKQQFVKHVIKGSRRADIIRKEVTDKDVSYLEDIIGIADLYASMSKDSDMSVWLYVNYDGRAHIAASWGGYIFSEINIQRDKDGEWQEIIVTDDDEWKAYQEMQCK